MTKATATRLTQRYYSGATSWTIATAIVVGTILASCRTENMAHSRDGVVVIGIVENDPRAVFLGKITSLYIRADERPILDMLVDASTYTFEASPTFDTVNSHWSAYSNDGRLLLSGAYVDGVESGVWSVIHQGAPRMKGAFVRGRRHGTWQWWSPDGSVRTDVEYDNGVELRSNQTKA